MYVRLVTLAFSRKQVAIRPKKHNSIISSTFTNFQTDFGEVELLLFTLKTHERGGGRGSGHGDVVVDHVHAENESQNNEPVGNKSWMSFVCPDK